MYQPLEVTNIKTEPTDSTSCDQQEIPTDVQVEIVKQENDCLVQTEIYIKTEVQQDEIQIAGTSHVMDLSDDVNLKMYEPIVKMECEDEIMQGSVDVTSEIKVGFACASNSIMSSEDQSDLDKAKMRKKIFFKKILRLEDEKKSHYNVMTRDLYSKIVGEVEEAKCAVKKTPLQYRRLKRFDILEIYNTKKLVSRSNPVKYYLPAEEIFDVIESAHIAVEHGGRDRLKTETGKKYANVTTEMINIFLSMCEKCQQKKSKMRKGLNSKPILHKEINSRCQVDLIDMQTQGDGNFKFIMVYQDHLTKFILLRPLQTKRAAEVASQLMNIFLTFGAPCILDSDNGRDFVNSIIKELTKLWPELKLVTGKQRRSQSQGLVECDNQDVENMLASWMQDNNTTHWSNGLPFVQFIKNQTFHSGINQSPFRAMFGTDPRVGLNTSALPSNVINNIQDEEDLQNVIEQINIQQNESEVFSENEGENEADFGVSHILSAKIEANENLSKQSNEIKCISDATHSSFSIKDNDIIPVLNVDRAKTDFQNLIGIVEKHDDMHKIGTKDVKLNKVHNRSEFHVGNENFVTLAEIPNINNSLETAAGNAMLTLQGFTSCVCKKACITKRCLCKKYQMLCNSKCHDSLPCGNK